jgi:hypothetical protein
MRNHRLGTIPCGNRWGQSTAIDEGVAVHNQQQLMTIPDLTHMQVKTAVHESVVDVLNGLGEDVCVTACKTMVPAYRKHVFAELRPVADGVLVRLALGAAPTKGRLAADTQGMPGERLTHAVTLRAKKVVDAALRGWLKTAYDLGAGAIARSTEFKTPADLKQALTKSKTAASTWASMTPAMQRDMVQWIESAKQAETRARRLATSLEKLAAGKKRVY